MARAVTAPPQRRPRSSHGDRHLHDIIALTPSPHCNRPPSRNGPRAYAKAGKRIILKHRPHAYSSSPSNYGHPRRQSVRRAVCMDPPASLPQWWPKREIQMIQEHFLESKSPNPWLFDQTPCLPASLRPTQRHLILGELARKSAVLPLGSSESELNSRNPGYLADLAQVVHSELQHPPQNQQSTSKHWGIKRAAIGRLDLRPSSHRSSRVGSMPCNGAEYPYQDRLCVSPQHRGRIPMDSLPWCGCQAIQKVDDSKRINQVAHLSNHHRTVRSKSESYSSLANQAQAAMNGARRPFADRACTTIHKRLFVARQPNCVAHEHSGWLDVHHQLHRGSEWACWCGQTMKHSELPRHLQMCTGLATESHHKVKQRDLQIVLLRVIQNSAALYMQAIWRGHLARHVVRLKRRVWLEKVRVLQRVERGRQGRRRARLLWIRRLRARTCGLLFIRSLIEDQKAAVRLSANQRFGDHNVVASNSVANG